MSLRIDSTRTGTVLSRAAQLIELMHLTESPTYLLAAAPQPAVSASRVFERRDSEIAKLLDDPPIVRDSGFDLESGIYADASTEVRRSFVEGYKGKELWADGTLVFVSRGDEDFLGWGERDPSEPILINPVTLIESAMLFCRLAAKLYDALGTRPSTVEFWLGFERMCVAGKKPRLRPGPVGNTVASRAKEAPDCKYHGSVVAKASADPDAVAYDLVSRVYDWFGHARDVVPYVSRQGHPRIDAQAIVAI